MSCHSDFNYDFTLCVIVDSAHEGSEENKCIKPELVVGSFLRLVQPSAPSGSD